MAYLCREDARAAEQRYRDRNRIRLRENWRLAYHRKKINLSDEEKERIREYQKKYRAENKERLKSAGIEYKKRPDVAERIRNKESSEERKSQKREYMKKEYKDNKDKFLDRNRVFRKQNPDYPATRSRRLYRECPQHKMRVLLRNRLNLAIKNNSKKGSAVSNLGCSIDEFIRFIEQKFTVEMTWDNWGKVWHLDHITPLSRFDLSDEIQFAKACHYTNMQPLFAIDNLKKGNSI